MVGRGRGWVDVGVYAESGPGPSVVSGVECEVVFEASRVGLPTFVPKGRAFTVKARVGTLTVSAFGLVFRDRAAVSFMEASTQTATRVDGFAVTTLVAKSLALETSDGFLLRLFGDCPLT